jgi:hypothetical protein
MNANTFSALIWNLTYNSTVNEGLGDVQCASEFFHFFCLFYEDLSTTGKPLCICIYVCENDIVQYHFMTLEFRVGRFLARYNQIY